MKKAQIRHSKLATFTLTDDVVTTLKELAAGSGLSLSATIRLLVLDAKRRKSLT